MERREKKKNASEQFGELVESKRNGRKEFLVPWWLIVRFSLIFFEGCNII